MAEVKGGFLSMPRRVLKDPIFGEPERLGAYAILQARAAYAPRVEEVSTHVTVRIMPGQLLYSERLMVDWTGWPRSKVRQVMASFLEEERISYPAGTDYSHAYVLQLTDPWVLFLRSPATNARENPQNPTRAGPVAAQAKEPTKSAERNQQGSENREKTRKAEPPKSAEKTRATRAKPQAGEGAVQSTAPKLNQGLVHPPTVSKGLRADRKVRSVENRPNVPSLEDFRFDARAEENQDERGQGGEIKRGETGGSPTVSAVPPLLERKPPPPPLPPHVNGARSALETPDAPDAADGVFASLQRQVRDSGLGGHQPSGRFARDDDNALAQLIRERGAGAVEQAIRGMAGLYPWSKGRPWSSRTLAQQFDLALATARPVQARQERSTLLQKAQDAWEGRVAEWQVRADQRWAQAPEDVRAGHLERAELQNPSTVGSEGDAFDRIRKRVVRDLAVAALSTELGDPQPPKPDLLR